MRCTCRLQTLWGHGGGSGLRCRPEQLLCQLPARVAPAGHCKLHADAQALCADLDLGLLLLLLLLVVMALLLMLMLMLHGSLHGQALHLLQDAQRPVRHACLPDA